MTSYREAVEMQCTKENNVAIVPSRCVIAFRQITRLSNMQDTVCNALCLERVLRGLVARLFGQTAHHMRAGLWPQGWLAQAVPGCWARKTASQPGSKQQPRRRITSPLMQASAYMWESGVLSLLVEAHWVSRAYTFMLPHALGGADA